MVPNLAMTQLTLNGHSRVVHIVGDHRQADTDGKNGDGGKSDRNEADESVRLHL